jgi:uncharacterized protein (DUF302 family)
MAYYISRIVERPFDKAIEDVTKALQSEGFGILTDIDVKATLKNKLNAEFRSYRILGACNPPLAHQALQTEDKIGVMLPCNVIVQDVGEGRIEIAAIDPTAAMERVGNASLADIAVTVRKKLSSVIDRI